jgi:hypothetical protein
MSLHIPDLKFCFFFFYCFVNIHLTGMGRLASFDLFKENTAGLDGQRQATADLAERWSVGNLGRLRYLSRPLCVGPPRRAPWERDKRGDPD